jgi:hypothetical protein
VLSCEAGDFPVELTDGSIFVHIEGRYRGGDVLRTECAAQAGEGVTSVPVVVSFF